MLLRRDAYEHGSWQGGLTLAGIDLVAMVVSDSGLSSINPQWWNSSPRGCVLIGSQPRGGWQVFQRTAQWGEDGWAHAFGVNCTKPILYEYFACSMRNRIEVWKSPRWISPMEGEKEANHWQAVGEAKVARPTKLIDGSRGGQAFICDLLRPRDNYRYTIDNQARVQFQSIILVVAGFLSLNSSNGVQELKQALREDFEISDRLGVVFKRLLPIVLVSNFLVLVLVTTVFYSLWGDNLYGVSDPYIIQLCSFASWAVGATGLLMMGGNPRVRLVSLELPPFVKDRIEALVCKDSVNDNDLDSCQSDEKARQRVQLIEVEFGSLHGSIYTPDYGTCVVPLEVVRAVCCWDLEFLRPRMWYVGVLWFASMLLCSVVLQIAGTKCATIWSEIMGVIVLIVTSLLRGSGISGREEWLIPRWKCRAQYGAKLQGVLESRSHQV